MGEPSAKPQRATWLSWIPLPALVLASDGSAVAVNERWADLSPVPAEGQGWLEAVEPAFRPAAWSMLRLATIVGQPGNADCPVAGPRGGLQSRWWWQPFSPGSLVVCVAVFDACPAESLPAPPPPRDAQDEAGIAAITVARPQSAGHAGALLDSVVKGVFIAGMSLQAAMDLPLPEAAELGITEALGHLDEVVREVRDHMLGEHLQQAKPGQPARPGRDARAALAANRAAALRDRVTQTAYALHLAAADTAELLEGRADLVEQPGRIDYRTEIKRWRVFAAQAKQMAESWEH